MKNSTHVADTGVKAPPVCKPMGLSMGLYIEILGSMISAGYRGAKNRETAQKKTKTVLKKAKTENCHQSGLVFRTLGVRVFFA